MTILHLARRADWDDALRTGEYRVSTRGVTIDDVGFIHAAFPHQLSAVAIRFFADAGETLCVLEMDEETIRDAGTPVVVEDGGNGELFPHIYGAIDPAWVRHVHPAGFDVQGRFEYW